MGKCYNPLPCWNIFRPIGGLIRIKNFKVYTFLCLGAKMSKIPLAKKKQYCYPKLSIAALILSAASFPFFGMPLPYAIGAGFAGMIRFLQKPQKQVSVFLFCFVAMLLPLLINYYMVGFQSFFSIFNLIVCLVFVLLFFCLSAPGESLISDILIAIVAGIPILKYLWFLVGTTVLKDDMTWRVFMIAYRMGLSFFIPITVLFLIIRIIKRFSFVRETVIRIILILTIPAMLTLFSKENKLTDRETFLDGFAKSVKDEVDFVSIQSWLNTQQIPEKDPNSQEDGLVLVQPENQPDCIKILSNGGEIGIRYDWNKKQFYIGKKREILFLFCFYWGLYISSDVCEKPDWVDGKNGEYLFITPSVFVWCKYSG